MCVVPSRGQKGRTDDDGEAAHKTWKVGSLGVVGSDGMTYEVLCQTIRQEFPDLAAEWSADFPELARIVDASSGGTRDDPRLETGRDPGDHQAGTYGGPLLGVRVPHPAASQAEESLAAPPGGPVGGEASPHQLMQPRGGAGRRDGRRKTEEKGKRNMMCNLSQGGCKDSQCEDQACGDGSCKPVDGG